MKKDVLSKREKAALEDLYQKYRRCVEWEDLLQEARLAKIILGKEQRALPRTNEELLSELIKRLTNYCNSVSHDPVSYSIPLDSCEVGHSDPIEIDLENEEENVREVLQIIENALTERQFYVFYANVVEGIPQATIANQLGVSHQYVALCLQVAIKKIRTLPSDLLARIRTLLED